MQYDPIKRSLGTFFNSMPILRILFYKLLDLLFLRAWYANQELRKLASENDTKIDILDAGSGYGQYSYRMAKLFPKATIYGVDVKTEQIEDCNNFFTQQGFGDRVKFDFADLTQFSSNKKFDLILSVDVMEHILDDRAVLKNFYNALSDDGLLLITTPSDAGDHDEEHEGNEASAAFVDEHVRDGYNIDELKEKLASAGFTRVEVNFTYGKPGKLAWKLSMKWPIMTLNFSKLFFILLPFYYIIVYPFAALLNYIDTKSTHKIGNGLQVKARK
ncbi:MAG: methyltransferase domain-containing protein [Prolixibacteraceae bacterium]|jgi:SAM-dependent methyltransferase|nr:methyltransferase domain-containing protein [Prolixibacteraceae bacterium]